MEHLTGHQFLEKYFPAFRNNWPLVSRLEQLETLAKNHASWEELMHSKKSRAQSFFQALDPEMLKGDEGKEVKKALMGYFEHVRSSLEFAEKRGRDLLGD